MQSFVSSWPRRALAALVAALVSFGVLAAAPSAQAATTLEYYGWTQVNADDSLWVSFIVSGTERTGTMTATFAGKTIALKSDPENPNPDQYDGTFVGPFPVGTSTITGKFKLSSGATVTKTAQIVVSPALNYAGNGSTLTWGVDALRTTVLGEGGAVTPSAGAVTDAARVRFPVTEYVKTKGVYQAGGVARFASAKRDVTLSDLQWSLPGETGTLRANATYRHPGQATRTERGVAIATLTYRGTGGDPWGFQTSATVAATAAGARVLGTTTGASLGQADWKISLAQKPQAAAVKIAVSPASHVFGKSSRATARVSRGGTYAAGVVTFKAGSRRLGTVRLSRGTAAATVPASLAGGAYAVTASYKADYSPTTAAARTGLVVTRAGTVTKAKLVKKKVTRKQRAKVKVTVAGRGTSVRPTGRVVVFDGKKRIKSATLSVSKRGKITVKLPKLKKRGKHKLRVTYAGSRSFRQSSTRVVLRVR